MSSIEEAIKARWLKKENPDGSSRLPYTYAALQTTAYADIETLLKQVAEQREQLARLAEIAGWYMRQVSVATSGAERLDAHNALDKLLRKIELDME